MPLTSWSRRLAATVVVGTLLGCSDDDPCDGGGEFANDGCAQIAGFIRSPDGQPMGGVLVSVRPPAGDSAHYTTPSPMTGATGRFVIDLFRLASEVPPRSQASLYLQMTLVRETSISKTRC